MGKVYRVWTSAPKLKFLVTSLVLGDAVLVSRSMKDAQKYVFTCRLLQLLLLMRLRMMTTMPIKMIIHVGPTYILSYLWSSGSAG